MSNDAQFEESDLVTSWFGYWPSLHDAEVLSLAFQRAIDGEGPGLRIKVHAFEMTSEVTEQGFFKLIKHCIIEFGFVQIGDVDLRHFGHQNVLDGISLQPTKDSRIAVEVETITEMQLSFPCAKAFVVCLTPGLPTEGVYAKAM